MKKQDKNMWIFVGLIVLAGVLIYGGSQGWFKSTFTLTPTIQLQPTPSQPIFSFCSQVCSQQGFNQGYSSSTCKAGESKVTYGYPNQAPLLTCCCYNEVIETPTDTSCRFHKIASPLNPLKSSDCYGTCPNGQSCSFSIVRNLPMCGCKAPVIEPIICHDDESELPFEEQLKTTGTCKDVNGTYTDWCEDDNALVDYYCGPTASPIIEQTCLGVETRLFCSGLIPGSHCEYGRCVL